MFSKIRSLGQTLAERIPPEAQKHGGWATMGGRMPQGRKRQGLLALGLLVLGVELGLWGLAGAGLLLFVDYFVEEHRRLWRS